jgi:hypothetical protein
MHNYIDTIQHPYIVIDAIVIPHTVSINNWVRASFYTFIIIRIQGTTVIKNFNEDGY